MPKQGNHRLWLTSPRHHTHKPLSELASAFLLANDLPHHLVNDLVEERAEKEGFKLHRENRLLEWIRSRLEGKGWVTFSKARDARQCRHPAQFHSAMRELREEVDIGRITHTRPHVFFIGISKEEAFRKSRPQPQLDEAQQDLWGNFVEHYRERFVEHPERYAPRKTYGETPTITPNDDWLSARLTIMKREISLLKQYDMASITRAAAAGEGLQEFLMQMGGD